MDIRCEGCTGEQASKCDAAFNAAALSLNYMVKKGESMENHEEALDFAAQSKRGAIDGPLLRHQVAIGCTLSDSQVLERLQQEVEDL